MAERLPVDSHVLGYWGFDESLETDVAFDESSGANNLTVTSSPGVSLGRIGNARSFNGSSTFAAPASSTSFRLQGELTLIGWIQITNYNTSGSNLRTIISCGGPTTGDNLLYSLSVDNSGRLVYKHTAASGEVVVRTAVATIRTNQIYSVAVRRTISGANRSIEFFVDNVQKAVSDVIVNGSASALPVPPPAANASATLSIGRSQKESDSAFWQGTLDEVSLHDIARVYQPYLRSAYYRIALTNDVSRLTYFDNIVSISSYEMGGGVRWWCFEKDKDLYVSKESPFGNFLPEVRLTTVGGGSASMTQKPELVYDPATDTLLVFFSSGNRIFKLTAQSTDDAATINMPYTADTGGIIKAVDNVEGGRFGTGGGAQIPNSLTYVNRQPIKFNAVDTSSIGLGGPDTNVVSIGVPSAPVIIFYTDPALGFGVLIGNTSTNFVTGYKLFRSDGQSFIELAAPTLLASGKYFVAVSPRRYGSTFIAEVLGPKNKRTGTYSNALVDRFNEVLLKGPGTLDVGRDSDGADSAPTGVGAGNQIPDSISYINRAPVKFSFQDTPAGNIGIGSGLAGTISSTGRGTVNL